MEVEGRYHPNLEIMQPCTSSKLKPPQNFWKYWYSKERHSFIINFYIPDFLALDIVFKNSITGEVLW